MGGAWPTNLGLRTAGDPSNRRLGAGDQHVSEEEVHQACVCGGVIGGVSFEDELFTACTACTACTRQQTTCCRGEAVPEDEVLLVGY